jgi:acyl carrier protein
VSEFTTQQILDGLAKLVAEETGIDAAEVQPDKSFTEDLDIDSLSMMTIVVNAQDEFDVEIPDDAVTELKTVGDAINYIAKSQAGAVVGQG